MTSIRTLLCLYFDIKFRLYVLSKMYSNFRAILLITVIYKYIYIFLLKDSSKVYKYCCSKIRSIRTVQIHVGVQ